MVTVRSKSAPAAAARGGNSPPQEAEEAESETWEAYYIANQSLLSVQFTAAAAAPRLHCALPHKHLTLPFPGMTKLAFSRR